MNGAGLLTAAQIVVERVLNSLPEGLLLVALTWALLRIFRRQNSETRFAVWFVALLAVVTLPFLNGFARSGGRVHASLPEIHLPSLGAVVLVAAWVLIGGAAMARLAVGLWQVARIQRSCKEIEEAGLDPALREIMRESRAARPVSLRVSEEVQVPMAIGFFRPAIVLPAWMMRELKAGELAPILVHERTHLQRWDDWTNLFQKMMRAVFFFHPAVWWIDARLSLEREMACDDAALAATGSAKAYANSLIDMLERSCERKGWTMAQAAVQKAKDLSLRLAQILEEKRPATTRIWKPALVVASLLSVGCFWLLLYAPRLVAFEPSASVTAAEMMELPRLPRSVHGAMREPAMGAAMVPASLSFPVPAHAKKPRHTVKQREKMAPRMVTTQAAEPVVTEQMMVFVETASYVLPQQNGPAVAEKRLGVAQSQGACVTEMDANGWKIQVCRMVWVAPVQVATVEGGLRDAI